MISDLLGGLFGGLFGVGLVESCRLARARWALDRLQQGKTAVITGYLQRDTESKGRQGKLVVRMQDEPVVSWLAHRAAEVEVAVECNLGIQDVRVKHYGWSTWVWRVQLPNGESAKMFVHSSLGRDLMDVLTPGHGTRSRRRH